MNLVEISEMLKGAPDTYLTQHIQTPDGSVPQYLALAELQRRQDMRARFAQQNPQSTVADDATQGIAAAGMAPPMAPPGAPPEAPPQGFAKGGEVKDTTLDQIMKSLGIRNLPSEKAAHEAAISRAQARTRNFEDKMSGQYREHMRNVMRAQDADLSRARKAMAPAENPALDQEFARQAAELSPEQVDAGYQEFLERQRQRKIRDDAIPGYPVGTDFDKVFAPIPAGYKEGGLIEQYIQRAGKFESGNNRNAKNPFSTASGRFQFIDSTRRRLDKKYGFDPKDRSDDAEAERMRVYTQETVDALESSNIPVTGGTLYGGHFLGQGGIRKFFDAYRKDPNANVSEHFSAEIIKKNPAIFNPRGGAPRTTLAAVMEKFDKVGGSGQRTPMSDEDMNLGAAVQVASRADRGDIGPYEDMNMKQAAALAQLLEPSKLARTPAPALSYLQMQNSADQQMRSQMLEQLGIPSGMTGPVGFAGGGVVKGYSGADGASSVAVRGPGEYYRYNPVTGQLEVDPNAPPYMPNMMAVDRGEVVPGFEYTDAELARQFGGGGKSITKDAKDSISPRPKNYDPMWGTAFLMGAGDMPPDVATGSAEKHREFLRSKKENKKEKPDATPPGVKFGDRAKDMLSIFNNKEPLEEKYRKSKKAAEGWEEWRDEQLAVKNPMIGKGDVPEALFEAGRYVTTLAGAVPWSLNKINQGANALESRLFENNVSGSWDKKPGPKPPSQFFYTPESAASTGGNGILGGVGINLPPGAPAAPPSAEDVAAATQRLREEAGVPAATAPSAPATTPPASKFDAFADQFLQELKDAKMSKEEMRSNALLQAGLGMMAGTSPHFFTNVGQGAMAGLQSYQQSKAQNQALASEAYKNMMAARAFGLDERKVAASEREIASESAYRDEMLKINKKRADDAIAKIAPNGLSSAATNLLSQIVQSEMANVKDLGKSLTEEQLAKLIMSRADMVRFAVGSQIDNVSDTEE